MQRILSLTPDLIGLIIFVALMAIPVRALLKHDRHKKLMERCDELSARCIGLRRLVRLNFERMTDVPREDCDEHARIEAEFTELVGFIAQHPEGDWETYRTKLTTCFNDWTTLLRRIGNRVCPSTLA